MTKERLNEIGGIILDASICVPGGPGPGFLDSAIRMALKRELELRNLHVRAHVIVELVNKLVDPGKVYEIDLLVEDEVIIETKFFDSPT